MIKLTDSDFTRLIAGEGSFVRLAHTSGFVNPDNRKEDILAKLNNLGYSEKQVDDFERLFSKGIAEPSEEAPAEQQKPAMPEEEKITIPGVEIPEMPEIDWDAFEEKYKI